jgi:hypothetical protein
MASLVDPAVRAAAHAEAATARDEAAAALRTFSDALLCDELLRGKTLPEGHTPEQAAAHDAEVDAARQARVSTRAAVRRACLVPTG